MNFLIVSLAEFSNPFIWIYKMPCKFNYLGLFPSMFKLNLNVICVLGLIFINQSYAQGLYESIQSAWGIDPSLQSAAANRVVAKENIGIAKARLLPQASIQGSQASLSQTTTQTTTLGPQANSFRGDSYSYTFQVRQGLFRPRDWVGLTIGRQQALYGELKFQSAKSDLWSRATNAWLDLLAAQMNKLSYDRAIRNVSESALQEKLKFEKGDGTKDSMIEAQAQLLQAKAMLKDAEFNLSSKLAAFKLMTGLELKDWSSRQLPEEQKVIFSKASKEQLWEKIQELTPELLAARLAESINQIKSDQAYYDQMPVLDLFGQATRAQNDTTNTLGYHYQNQQVGVQLNVPLYTGGGLQATKRQAVASLESSIADKEALSQKIETQFLSDWATQEGLKERALAARSLVLSAKEQKKATEMALQKGIRTWSDVSNAEILLVRRESDLINIQLNLYKIQARILSFLPSDDPSWDDWIQQMDLSSLY